MVERQVKSATRGDAEADLEATLHAVEQMAEERGEQRRSQASLAARSETLIEGLRVGDRPLLQSGLERLLPTLRDASFFAVVGLDGTLLSAAGEVLDRHSVDTLPPPLVSPVQEALGSDTSGAEGAANGIWILEGDILEIAAAPVIDGTGERLGAILLAERLDGVLAGRLQQTSPSQVVILADSHIVASSLGPAEAHRVKELFFPENGEPARLDSHPREIHIGGTSYLVQLTHTRVQYGGSYCNHILLRSLEPAQALAASIRGNLLALGFVALVLAFAIAWIGARRIARPLHDLAETMSDISRSGRLDSPLPVPGGGRELRLLQDAFYRMLSSLRESEEARERSYVEAIGAVMAAVDRRDQESAGHSYRVAYYAGTLARHLELDDEELRAVEWGALLHDVGKIAVPDQILRKSGPLTEKEWQIMRQHPRWGYEMLAEVEFLKPALDIVFNHHERWDGTGYPRGLEKEEIPLSARIFSVVDTYDAITSDRHYRTAKSHERAVEELQRVAGDQLDPRVVGAFLELSPMELRKLRTLSEETVAGIKIPTPIQELLTELRTGTRG